MDKLIMVMLCAAVAASLPTEPPLEPTQTAAPQDAVQPQDAHLPQDDVQPQDLVGPRALPVDSEAQEYMVELLLRILSGDVVVEQEAVYDVVDPVPTDDESQTLSRRRRDTVVFRPLFATRQREAARLNRMQQQARHGRRSQPRQGRRNYPQQRQPASINPGGRYGRSAIFAMPPLFVARQREADLLERSRMMHRYREEEAEEDRERESGEWGLSDGRRSKRQATFTPLFVAKQRQALRVARQQRRNTRARRTRPRRT